MDATWNDPAANIDPNLISHKFFNISDVQASVEHTWDRTLYPKCITNNTSLPSSIVTINNHLYRMNSDGSSKSMIIGDGVGDFVVVGDWVYYVNYSDNWNLYKMTTLGAKKTKLTSNSVRFVNVADKWVYYISYQGSNLYRINTDGSGKLTLASGYIVTWRKIVGNMIYFKGFTWKNGVGIYRMKLDGTGLIRIGKDIPTGFKYVGKSIQYYFVDNDLLYNNNWLFYINSSDGYKLYKITASGSIRTKLCNDYVIDISQFGNYIYYKTNKGLFYKIRYDGTQPILLN